MAAFGISPRDPLDYTGIRLAVVPTVDAPRAPTTADRKYPIQTIWRDNTTNDEWMLRGIENGLAEWKLIDGDVDGPASSTDNAFARFDGTTGKLLQNSVVIGTDAGAVSGITQLDVDNIRIDGNTVSSTNTNGNIVLDANGTGIISAADDVRLDTGKAVQTAQSAGNTALLQAYDVDNTVYTTFITLTANNTPTCNLDDSVTKAGQYIYRAGGTDVPVADGGTGTSSLTDRGVLVGRGTSAVEATTAGTTGQLLVASTGANPAFASSADADFNFTSATSGATRTVTVDNTSDTASSQASVNIKVAGTSAGDCWAQFTNGTTQSYALGIDNSDSDILKLTQAASGTVNPSTASPIMTVTSSGQFNFPLQPAFAAYINASINNVTGNNTMYSIIWNAEDFDIGSNFSTVTGLFTAPISGKYIFTTCVQMEGITAAAADFLLRFNINSATITYEFSEDISGWDGTYKTGTISHIINLSAADTVGVDVRGQGEAGDVWDVKGVAGARRFCFFSGQLIS